MLRNLITFDRFRNCFSRCHLISPKVRIYEIFTCDYYLSFVAGVVNAGTCMLAVAVVVVVVEAAVGGKDFAVAVVDDFASSFP